MGQIWTKNKPDKAGSYWVSYANDHATVVRVTLYDYYGNDTPELCYWFPGDDEPYRLDKAPSSMLWGSTPLPEPQSVKY